MSMLKWPSRFDQKITAIKFAQAGGNGAVVVLPAPSGLSFSDTAEYSSADIGIAGTAMADITKMFGGEGADAGAEERKARLQSAGITDVAGSVKDAMMTVASSSGAGKTLNEFTVTEFKGTTTRDHTFKFNMVPENAAEAKTIVAICNTFQESIYPTTDATTIILNYPPTWKISIEGDSSSFMAQYYEECFLTSCNITYNEQSTAYFEDGSPTDISLEIAFKESKSLQNTHIKKLLAGAGGVSAAGGN